jgi:hypothetical protein
MEDVTRGKFYNPTKGYITFREVMEEIFSYMKEKPEKSYEVILGCDSSSGREPAFPIAIVILRKGEGGRFFLKKIRYHKRKFYNLHQRVLEEVLLSCEMALILREELKKGAEVQKVPSNFEFNYIHADIGENGATKDMIKEITGLIRGNGFEPKIKPESYAATVVADRYT